MTDSLMRHLVYKALGKAGSGGSGGSGVKTFVAEVFAHTDGSGTHFRLSKVFKNTLGAEPSTPSYSDGFLAIAFSDDVFSSNNTTVAVLSAVVSNSEGYLVSLPGCVGLFDYYNSIGVIIADSDGNPPASWEGFRVQIEVNVYEE